MSESSGVTLETAIKVVEAAAKRAADLGVRSNIAVVDAGNNLVAFARMDGAWLGSIDIAQDKAYTARAFDMSTLDLAALCQPGQPLDGIQASNRGQLTIFPGGIPLSANGSVVGAVGVSGGSVEQDQEVAQAGANAF